LKLMFSQDTHLRTFMWLCLSLFSSSLLMSLSRKRSIVQEIVEKRGLCGRCLH
jgi:hypothetical protein